jgi:hypothetical protein
VGISQLSHTVCAVMRTVNNKHTVPAQHAHLGLLSRLGRMPAACTARLCRTAAAGSSDASFQVGCVCRWIRHCVTMHVCLAHAQSGLCNAGPCTLGCMLCRCKLDYKKLHLLHYTTAPRPPLTVRVGDHTRQVPEADAMPSGQGPHALPVVQVARPGNVVTQEVLDVTLVSVGCMGKRQGAARCLRDKEKGRELAG